MTNSLPGICISVFRVSLSCLALAALLLAGGDHTTQPGIDGGGPWDLGPHGDFAFPNLPGGNAFITSDKVEGTNRQVVATFKAPNFVGSDGKIKLDSAGKPVAQGEREV